MALTEAERANSRAYLGYPQLFQQQFTRLESAMDLIGENADQYALLQSYLAALVVIETSLVSALATSGMTGVGNGEVEWDIDNSRIKGLRKEGRRWCNRLSNLLGVEILSDPFGEQGYPSDKWLSHGWFAPLPFSKP